MEQCNKEPRCQGMKLRIEKERDRLIVTVPGTESEEFEGLLYAKDIFFKDRADVEDEALGYCVIYEVDNDKEEAWELLKPFSV